MEGNSLSQQITALMQSLLDEGFLDKNFFQLEMLEDENNHNFVEDVVTLFFVDSANLIIDMEKEFKNDPIEYENVDKLLHQFKGSSTSIGAIRVAFQVNKLRESCKEQDVEGWKAALEELKDELTAVEEKLIIYLQLLKQCGPEEKAVLREKAGLREKPVPQERAVSPGEEEVDILTKEQLTTMMLTDDETQDVVPLERGSLKDAKGATEEGPVKAE